MAPYIRSDGPSTGTKRARSTKALSQKAKRMPVYQSVSRNPTYGGPFPPIKKAQVVYSAVVSPGVTTGNGVYIFSANGIYDPDISGTGSQPLYFDQLMALYNHYVVTSSSIEVDIMNEGTNRSVIATCYVDDDVNTAANFTAMQRPGAKVVTGNPLSSNMGRLRNFYSSRKVFGPNVENNYLYRGSTSTNPTEQAYFVIQIQDLGLASYNQPIRVTIRYNTTFSELTTIAGS